MLAMDIAALIFKILKQPQLNYLTQVFFIKKKILFLSLCFLFHLYSFYSSQRYIHSWPNIYKNMSFIQFQFHSRKIYLFQWPSLFISLAFILCSYPSFLYQSNTLLHVRMILNLFYVSFQLLIQGWSSCRARLSFKRDMVCNCRLMIMSLNSSSAQFFKTLFQLRKFCFTYESSISMRCTQVWSLCDLRWYLCDTFLVPNNKDNCRH